MTTRTGIINGNLEGYHSEYGDSATLPLAHAHHQQTSQWRKDDPDHFQLTNTLLRTSKSPRLQHNAQLKYDSERRSRMVHER